MNSMITLILGCIGVLAFVVFVITLVFKRVSLLKKLPGPQGPTGPKGDRGDKGADGITPSLEIRDGHLWVIYDDGETKEIDLGEIIGQAKNIEQDETHRFVTDDEKQKWNDAYDYIFSKKKIKMEE